MASNQGQISTGEWLKWYFGTLVFGVSLAFAANWLFGLHLMHGVFLYCGVLFLAAAADRPHVLFRMLRNVRWFALIESDRAVRWTIGIIGAAVTIAGLLMPNVGEW